MGHRVQIMAEKQVKEGRISIQMDFPDKLLGDFYCLPKKLSGLTGNY